MRIIFVTLLLMAPLPAIAQEQTVDVDAQFKLLVDAIETAAQVDAYNGYCDKDTQISADLVKRVEMAGLIEEGDDALRNFQQEHYIYFAQGLKDKGADCKNVDFLLEKLEVFKKMKHIMGVINGDKQGEVSE